MALLATLFSDLRPTNPDWQLITINDHEMLLRTMRFGDTCCVTTVESGTANSLKYKSAVQQGERMTVAFHTHTGSSTRDLAHCLELAAEAARKMLAH